MSVYACVLQELYFLGIRFAELIRSIRPIRNTNLALVGNRKTSALHRGCLLHCTGFPDTLHRGCPSALCSCMHAVLAKKGSTGMKSSKHKTRFYEEKSMIGRARVHVCIFPACKHSFVYACRFGMDEEKFGGIGVQWYLLPGCLKMCYFGGRFGLNASTICSRAVYKCDMLVVVL